MSDVRVRFSPAPTGMMHIGNARTALFNWLYARHTGGTFILRIEDTDVVRSTTTAVEQIQVVLRWLGLDWDEGPVLQSRRFDRYLEAARRLRDQGDAYECYCTEDEIRARNEAARSEGKTPGYDGRCRDLAPAQRDAFVAEGRAASIRFRTPDDGRSEFVDIIRGDVSVAWSTVSDFVIVRSNGTPVFFLANAVDDLEMAITHVLRGEDLIDSTHRVLALRRALGADDQPAYAHLPLILGPGGGKLSKRHGADKVEQFRDAGYLPAAVVNYLALLGWAPPDEHEVLTLDELVAAFDLERVHQAAATFDPQKLEWLDAQHIKALTIPELTAAVLPFARDRYGARLDIVVFEAAVALARERATTLEQIAEQAEFLFTPDDDLVIDAASWEKVLRNEKAAEILDAAIERIESCEWTADGVDLRDPVKALDLKPNKALPVVYAAIEGRTAGLPLFGSIYLLGRDSTLRRLRAARQRLGTA
jgi:glutamyl-tRNA synthetase